VKIIEKVTIEYRDDFDAAAGVWARGEVEICRRPAEESLEEWAVRLVATVLMVVDKVNDDSRTPRA